MHLTLPRWSAALMAAFLVFSSAACGSDTDSVADDAANVADDAGAVDDTDGADAGAEEVAAEPETATESEAPAAADTGVGKLDTVLARGDLSCGVNDQLPGFGSVDSDGEFAGFDVDFCRAIAAAVLGDAEAVTFRPLSSQQRFTALQTGEVDVLVRNTTWTLSRDTQNGLDFGPTTFYDGQGLMARTALGIEELADLDGASICVGSGTTTERNLGDVMREAGVEYTSVTFEGADQVMGSYDSGRCDAVTADLSALVTRKPTMANPDEHEILDMVLSKEPLGPAVLQGDAEWADVVNWVSFGVMQAEEFGIDSGNIGNFMDSDNPEIRRFLGLEDGLGEGLGIGNGFMVDVIEQVGNYSEIYERNLGADTPFDLPRGVNQLWSDGGLLYAPPFR